MGPALLAHFADGGGRAPGVQVLRKLPTHSRLCRERRYCSEKSFVANLFHGGTDNRSRRIGFTWGVNQYRNDAKQHIIFCVDTEAFVADRHGHSLDWYVARLNNDAF